MNTKNIKGNTVRLLRYEATSLVGEPLEVQAIGPNTNCYSAYLIDLTSDLTVARTPRDYIF